MQVRNKNKIIGMVRDLDFNLQAYQHWLAQAIMNECGDIIGRQSFGRAEKCMFSPAASQSFK